MATTTNSNASHHHDHHEPSVSHIERSPIYVTIGPQNAGKTTFLATLSRRHDGMPDAGAGTSTQSPSSSTISALPEPAHSSCVQDITIDDQQGVYIPTPIELWFLNQQPSRKKTTEDMFSLLRTNVHGKTISERIYDVNGNHEMRFVIQRLNNIISAYEFRQKLSSLDDGGCTNSNLKQLYKKDRVSSSSNRNMNRNASVNWKESLIDIVEDFHRKTTSNNDIHNMRKSAIVQLFVPESIFKNQSPILSSLLSTCTSTSCNNNNNNNNHMMMSGLNAATAKLNNLAMNQHNIPLAWGNTNKNVRDYITALDAAEKSQRPVIFIPYMDEEQTRGIQLHDILPRVDTNQLFLRNIQRCYSTGKYVPVKAIIDACLRVDELIDKAMSEMKVHFQKKDAKFNGTHGKNAQFTKFQFDHILAKIAGYHMNDDRTVHRIIHETKSTYNKPIRDNLHNANRRDRSNGNCNKRGG